MLAYGKRSIKDILGRQSIHPFPARMAPGIALRALESSRGCLRVLDPMVGSGTVLAVARSRGHRAIGVDVDPLAILTAKVWTSAIDTDSARDKALEVLDRAKRAFFQKRVRDAYPPGADEETRRFVRYWFDDYARRQLASLAQTIAKIRCGRTRDALWCAFSRLIISKQSGASLAMDLSHSRPHKVFARAPSKPFRSFVRAANRVLDNCIDIRERHRGPATQVLAGDARKLPLANDSIDLVLTSPPYLNAIDYIRCSKFSLVWMNRRMGELRRIRSESIGTEVGEYGSESDYCERIIANLGLRPALGPRQHAVLARFVKDMIATVGEIARVLKRNGSAVFVVGENTIRGTYVPNAKVVSEAANIAGLALETRYERTLPSNRRYLPARSPRANGSSALDARIRREVVLSFSRL